MRVVPRGGRGVAERRCGCEAAPQRQHSRQSHSRAIRMEVLCCTATMCRTVRSEAQRTLGSLTHLTRGPAAATSAPLPLVLAPLPLLLAPWPFEATASALTAAVPASAASAAAACARSCALTCRAVGQGGGRLWRGAGAGAGAGLRAHMGSLIVARAQSRRAVWAAMTHGPSCRPHSVHQHYGLHSRQAGLHTPPLAALRCGAVSRTSSIASCGMNIFSLICTRFKHSNDQVGQQRASGRDVKQPLNGRCFHAASSAILLMTDAVPPPPQPYPHLRLTDPHTASGFYTFCPSSHCLVAHGMSPHII